ncbi:MAG TPA: cyclic nucleotide-binding domain-containing protein, partial [Roseobacter sp.]|nr:cyclic nucleotide-binding domain-containing protein [Roseobacter sp.]
LAERRNSAESRPTLDIAVQRIELVRQFPLFVDLDEKALKRLGRALKTRYVNAGKVIVPKDSAQKSVVFIASGAVELKSSGQTWRLGRGEMFGQMAILMNEARRVEVQAIAPSTLLILDEKRFRSLLARSSALRDAVRASAEQRGIDPEKLLFEATRKGKT